MIPPRRDGLPGIVWEEFEFLRWEKTPALRERFTDAGTYFRWQQAQDRPGVVLVEGLLITEG